MKRYIDAEKLKAEIEKLKKEARENALIASDNNNTPVCASWAGKENICMDILSIIASLQQEQPDEDLEKEIDVCWKNWLSPSNQKDVEGVLPKTEFAMYARHFWNKGYNARKEDNNE